MNPLLKIHFKLGHQVHVLSYGEVVLFIPLNGKFFPYMILSGRQKHGQYCPSFSRIFIVMLMLLSDNITESPRLLEYIAGLSLCLQSSSFVLNVILPGHALPVASLIIDNLYCENEKPMNLCK